MIRRKDNKGRVLEKGESQRKDGLYMYRYTDLSGKRECVYNSDLSKLRDIEREISKDIGDMIDISVAQKRTLNEQFERYMNTKLKLAPSSRRTYLLCWKNHVQNSTLGNMPLANIRKSDILLLYASLVQKGLSSSTITMVHGNLISPTLELATDDDIIRKNPSAGCLREIPKTRKIKKFSLSLEQEHILVDFVKNNGKYKKYYPLIVCLLETGARISELISLTWNDVDFKGKTLDINHQIACRANPDTTSRERYIAPLKTKNSYRTIPLTQTALSAFHQQKIMQFEKNTRSDIVIDGHSDFIFTTRNKKTLSCSNIRRTFNDIVNDINAKNPNIDFPHISPHILRHTACTRMAESGMDIKILQYVMGHADMSITMEVYNHVTDDRIRREINKAEAWKKAQ